MVVNVYFPTLRWQKFPGGQYVALCVLITIYSCVSAVGGAHKIEKSQNQFYNYILLCFADCLQFCRVAAPYNLID